MLSKFITIDMLVEYHGHRKPDREPIFDIIYSLIYLIVIKVNEKDEVN